MYRYLKLFPKTILAGLTLVTLALSACLPAAKPTDPNALYTQAVQTVSVQLTQSAGVTAVAQLTQMVQNSPTPPPPTLTTQPPTPTATLQADTPIPPTRTSQPPTPTLSQPSPTPRPCDAAQFVADVSVKDGSTFQAGSRFTKTWRLKNIGTCTWTPDYDLVFANGSRMDGAKAVSLGSKVRPGETIDVSITLVAPSEPGEYMGKWMLRNSDGQLFGVGDQHNRSFWVSIKVVKPFKLAWDMTKDYCLATWSSRAISGLACPDLSENTEIGFINLHPKPVLENGSTDNEPALVTFPNQGKGGFIQGVFPAFKIRQGDHFRAVIGCLHNQEACKVIFQLSYRTSNGRVKILESWREKYDEKIRKIDVDLSDLAGKEVELILTVFSLDDSTDDFAFWLLPSIWR